MLHVRSEKPWEFSSDFPQRSIIFPCVWLPHLDRPTPCSTLTSGLPFLALRAVHGAAQSLGLIDPSMCLPNCVCLRHVRHVAGHPVSPHALLLAPRLMMLMFSIAMDVLAYELCVRLRLHPWHALWAIGSSFITLVFHLRCGVAVEPQALTRRQPVQQQH